MSNNATLAWWHQATHTLWARWIAGYAPSPASWPPPPDYDCIPPVIGVPLPGPVSSGWALDNYRDRSWWRRRTRVGVEMWRFKYRGDLDAGWRLVHAAARFLSQQEMVAAVDYVIPAPSSPEFRDFSPSLWLGDKLAATINLPVLHNVFDRSRLGMPQKELPTTQARRTNVNGMFKVKHNIKRKISGKRLLLVDDLSRSGYTLAELRQTLHHAGSGKIIPFTFTKAGGGRQKL